MGIFLIIKLQLKFHNYLVSSSRCLDQLVGIF